MVPIKKQKKTRQSTGKKANKRGKFAEKAVLGLMRVKGYRLIEKNFKTKRGTGLSEVDLILRKHKTLVFAEVKERLNADHLPFAVTDDMKKRIVKAAAFYLSRHPEYALFDIRFDVVFVKFPFTFRHVKNAWYENWY